MTYISSSRSLMFIRMGNHIINPAEIQTIYKDSDRDQVWVVIRDGSHALDGIKSLDEAFEILCKALQG